MKKVFLVGLFLSLLPQLFAQEFIKESDCAKHDTSIVREYKNGQWLVCQGYKQYTYWRFMLVTETGTSGSVLTLFDYEMKINDMEINGDIVYFCGEMKDTGNSRAMLGYFDMSGFPFSTVHACFLNDLSSFEKMEVFFLRPSYTHIAMTGIKPGGSYCMVDAMGNGTNSFDFIVVDTLGDIKKLDDVARTDNYVVYSAHDEHYYGCLLFHNILPSGTFLTTSLIRESIGTSVSSEILLEHCGLDTLAYVTFPSQNHFMESLLNGTTLLYSSIHNIPQSDFSLLDVKYDLMKGFLNVLFYEYTANNSVIVDFSHSPLANRAYGRRYINQPLYSLDYLKNQPGQCVASGQREDRGPLRLYRYITGQYEGCAVPYMTDKTLITLFPVSEYMEINPWMKQIQATVLDSDVREELISTICEIKETE